MPSCVWEPGRGSAAAGGSRRWPRAGGPRAGRAGAGARRRRLPEFVRGSAGDPHSRLCRGSPPAAVPGIPSRGGQQPRPVPLPPALSPGRRRAPRAKGAGRAEHKLGEVLAVGRPRWGTEQWLGGWKQCWVRGALGAWARKRRIPHPAAWQLSGLEYGPEERGRDRQ